MNMEQKNPIVIAFKNFIEFKILALKVWYYEQNIIE